MHVAVATRAYLPYPYAASINIVGGCVGLARLGHRVTMLAGWKLHRPPLGRGSVWDYYGVERCFDLIRFVEFPRVGWWFDRRVTEWAKRAGALLYTRDLRLLAPAARAGVPCIAEVHTEVGPRDQAVLGEALLSGAALGLVVITEALRQHFDRVLPRAVPRDKIVVAPDAVDPHRFRPAPDRRTGSLPRMTVGYVGSLFPGKGLEILVPLARRMPDVRFVVWGGSRRDVRAWRRRTRDVPNLRFAGFAPPRDVPSILQRLDVGLVPNQPHVVLRSGTDIGPYTSPTKIFEYMASGIPMIVSDLPVLREVVRPGENALVARHDDVGDWQEKLERLRSDDHLRARLAQNSRREAVERFSHEARFREIFRQLGPTLSPSHSPDRPEDVQSRTPSGTGPVR